MVSEGCRVLLATPELQVDWDSRVHKVYPETPAPVVLQDRLALPDHQGSGDYVDHPESRETLATAGHRDLLDLQDGGVL